MPDPEKPDPLLATFEKNLGLVGASAYEWLDGMVITRDFPGFLNSYILLVAKSVVRSARHQSRGKIKLDYSFLPALEMANPTQGEHRRSLELLEVEHKQKFRYARAEHKKNAEYARVEHERRMQVIEAEAALVEVRRRRLDEETLPAHESPEVLPAALPKPASLETIREALIYHLGSPVAAAAWLNSPDTGYPTTAMDAIRAGKADVVMADLEQQWGPSPCYA